MPDENHVGLRKNRADATSQFPTPFRSKSHRHNEPLSDFSGLGLVPEGYHERATLSLDLHRRLAQFGDAKYRALSPEVRLRGGGSQHWAGKFKWLRSARGLNKTPDKSKLGSESSAVTYKGMVIGSPQPAPALNVLPPASRFAREPEVRASATAARSSFQNSNGVLVHGSSTPSERDGCGAAYIDAPPRPPLPALLPTQSRPATTNPFAGVYGNPYAVRANPQSPAVNYEVAGSPIKRPSALDRSQTGYDSRPDPSRKNPFGPSSEAAFNTGCHQQPAVESRVQQGGMNRKWGALPPLPRREGAPEQPSRNDKEVEDRGVNEEYFDTEEVLSSLRPDRLSLYHIATPVRPVNSSRPIGHNASRAPDSYSIRIRDWDLHSCNTDNLGTDTQQERLEQSAGRSAQDALPQEQQHQVDGRNNDDLVYGMPAEGAPTPESWFYAEMIEIVNDYHEQLQRLVQGAYDAGQVNEEQWLRDKWTYRKALDRKLRIAEDMSSYKVQAYPAHLPNTLTLQQILTNEKDIKQAIQRPTGYAIYSSLLRIRDPETWQRVFEPTKTYPHLGIITSTSQQHGTEQETSTLWFLRKIGRGLRYMLAAPSAPDLKTHSSSHPPAPDPEFATYASNVGVLGPNTPYRLQKTIASKNTAPATTTPSTPSRNLAPREKTRLGTNTEPPLKHLTGTTRINNTIFTAAMLASPINARIKVAARSRGYEQGAFVTVITPSCQHRERENDRWMGCW
jgi:hypothetical protein